jgi:hypothetical protein
MSDLNKLLSWDVFVARRKLDVQAWLKRYEIYSYPDLVKRCQYLGIEPPKEQSVEFPFVPISPDEITLKLENPGEILEVEEKPKRKRKKEVNE